MQRHTYHMIDDKSSCRSNFSMWVVDRKQGIYNWQHNSGIDLCIVHYAL